MDLTNFELNNPGWVVTESDIDTDDDKSTVFTDDDKSTDSYERKFYKPKIIDKACHKLVQKKNGIDSSIKFYTTKYTPGSRIRNAETGYFENTLVGRDGEFDYFKVTLSGQLGQDPHSKHLYYYSPEQYERHFQIVLDQQIKNKFFQSKKQFAFRSLELHEVVKKI